MTRAAEGAAALAVIPLLMGLVVIAVGVLRVPAAERAGVAELAASLSLGLEFLLAGGLLRLSSLDTFGALAVVAAVVLLRKLIGRGIGYGLRALGVARIRAIRA